MPEKSPTAIAAEPSPGMSREATPDGLYEAPRLIYLGHVSALLAATSKSTQNDAQDTCDARVATKECPV